MKLFISILILFIVSGLEAQTSESSIIVQDTTITDTLSEDLIIKTQFKPIPKKALLYSLIFPGAGQFYNKSYWKLPLVVAAYGGLIYAFDFNSTAHDRWKLAYEYRLDGLEETVDEFTEKGLTISDSAIKSQRDFHRKNLELTYMAAIIVHALNGIEAYVDAHLKNFDISEDLSLSIQPTFNDTSVGMTSGIGLVLSFK